MAIKLDMERSAHRRRWNRERREKIAAGKTPRLGSALVKSTGRDTRYRIDRALTRNQQYRFTCDAVVRNPPHWLACNATTSIRRLMRAGRQMQQHERAKASA